MSIAGCREELLDLLQTHDCRTLAIDLTGVVLMPAGLLGLLEQIHDQGVDILLYNPSDDIRETLHITGRDGMVQMHEVEM